MPALDSNFTISALPYSSSRSSALCSDQGALCPSEVDSTPLTSVNFYVPQGVRLHRTGALTSRRLPTTSTRALTGTRRAARSASTALAPASSSSRRPRILARPACPPTSCPTRRVIWRSEASLFRLLSLSCCILVVVFIVIAGHLASGVYSSHLVVHRGLLERLTDRLDLLVRVAAGRARLELLEPLANRRARVIAVRARLQQAADARLLLFGQPADRQLPWP